MAESKKIEALLKEVEGLTVLELSELVKALEDKFGPAGSFRKCTGGGRSPG